MNIYTLKLIHKNGIFLKTKYFPEGNMCVPVRHRHVILSSDSILRVTLYKLLYHAIILSPMSHIFCFHLDWQVLMAD